MKRTCRSAVAIAAVTTFTAVAPAVMAHGDGGDAKAPKTSLSSDQHAFGVEGDPKNASRKINMSAADSMHYSKSEIRVVQGETVTFVLSNKGKLLHELIIGTEDELTNHAAVMRKNPGMEHEQPYMMHVKPGATGRMTWKFTNAGTFLFGCLVAGHFEAGMKGQIVVAASK